MSLSFVYAFAMIMGFALAGVSGSLFRLITKRRISFELAGTDRPVIFLGVMILMFAGPAVIMRNAIRGRLIENRALYWLALSTLIAGMWSFLAGITLINGLNVLHG
jgi:Family of unknown function (DUF6949)